METYFTWDYAGTPFELFGPAHIASLVIFAVLGWLVLRAGDAADDTRRQALRRGMVAVLVGNEAAWHTWNLWHGHWDLETMLPLHACSFMVWWSAWSLWFDRRWMHAPIYFMGIAGAMQALITPDAGVYGFPHFRFFQTMIAHAVLVLGGIWVARVDGFRPTLRNGAVVLAALNGYALLVYFVNLAVGSNYLYVNGKPEVPSLIDAMPAWPWYIPILELLAVFFFVLLWLPYRRTPPPAPAGAPLAPEIVRIDS